jgi:hypothetical protein
MDGNLVQKGFVNRVADLLDIDMHRIEVAVQPDFKTATSREGRIKLPVGWLEKVGAFEAGKEVVKLLYFARDYLDTHNSDAATPARIANALNLLNEESFLQCENEARAGVAT